MTLEYCRVKECLARKNLQAPDQRCMFQFDECFDLDMKQQKVLQRRYSRCTNSNFEIFSSMGIHEYKTKW